MRPNVLQLIDSFQSGGSERQAVQLTRLLHESGRYCVYVASLYEQGVLRTDIERLGLGEIPSFPLNRLYNRKAIMQVRRFARYLREKKISIVHTHDFYTNIFGIAGAALACVPVRIAYRGDSGGWRTPAQDFIDRCSYRLAHAVHANSEAVRDFLIKSGVPPQKIITIHNGLDMPRLTPAASLRRDDVIKRFGLPRDARRRFITLVANMRHEIKDHPMFLRAAQRVQAAIPEATFILAGEGELMEQVRALAVQLGLGPNAYFVGHCENMAELLWISDVCVLASKAEGFSNVILEYMAAARPVVVTDVGGAREAVIDGESGYLVQSGDDEAMATRIISLLNDHRRASAMGAFGRSLVEEKFSERAQLEGTHAMYDQLLARRLRHVPRRLNRMGRDGV